MILDNFESSFITAGFPCISSYDSEMSDINLSEHIEPLITANGVARVLQIGDDIPQHLSDYSLDTYNTIENGRLFMFTIAQAPKDTVDKAILWLKEIYNLGGVLGPFAREFIFNELKLWRFEPVGGVVQSAEKYGGGFYYVAQPIEYAAEIL